MIASHIAAVCAAALLVLLAVFQVLLAAGLPLGHAAWGGRHRGVLPPALRWASLAAAGILCGAAWVALARADLVAPGAEPLGISIATWCFAAYFSLNVAGNLLSQSTLERAVMTPVAALLALCFITLAFS